MNTCPFSVDAAELNITGNVTVPSQDTNNCPGQYTSASLSTYPLLPAGDPKVQAAPFLVNISFHKSYSSPFKQPQVMSIAGQQGLL